MEEYVFILELLEKLQIEQKLNKLSKKFGDKKVVLFGANNALDAICSKYDLKKYFNIIGICDELFLKENIFEYNDFKVISLQNLYFSGVEVLINLKDEFAPIEKNFRKNRLIKKRVKVIHLLNKSIQEKTLEFYEKLKATFKSFKTSKKYFTIFKDFCTYNKEEFISKLNYQEIITKLSENKSKPIRVLFIVNEYETWNLQRLYEKMNVDENFKVLPIIALPPSLQENAITEKETIEFFKNQGMECIDGFEYVTQEAVMVKALKPDIVFYQQPQFIKSDFKAQNISNYALTCYVESEFILSKREEFNSNFYQNRLNNTWKIFTTEHFSINKFKNIKKVGFATFEQYKEEAKDDFEKVWSKSDNILTNRIVYAPFYSINENFNITKFKEQQDYILDFATKHPQYSFVIIPHRNLYEKCIERKIFTNDELESIKNSWKMLPNAVIMDETLSIEIFKTSDIIITDCLETVALYFPTAKPIIFLENNQLKNLNNLGEKIYKTLYKISSLSAIEIILEDILISKNDYNSENRNMILSKNHKFFEEETSQQIFDYLKQELGRLEINT